MRDTRGDGFGDFNIKIEKNKLPNSKIYNNNSELNVKNVSNLNSESNINNQVNNEPFVKQSKVTNYINQYLEEE